MKKTETTLWTPPSWGSFVVGLCLLGIMLNAVYYTHGSWTGIFRDVFTAIYTLCVLLVTIWSGIHYSFSEKGFVVRLFGIPLKSLKWEDVGSAIYMHTWRVHRDAPGVFAHGVEKGHSIMISLHYCPPFCPEYDIRPYFSMAHPFTSIFITLPYGKQEAFLDLFKRNVVKMEIQAPDAWDHM